MALSKFTRHQVITRMLDVGIVPVFYQKDLEVAKKILEMRISLSVMPIK